MGIFSFIKRGAQSLAKRGIIRGSIGRALGYKGRSGRSRTRTTSRVTTPRRTVNPFLRRGTSAFSPVVPKPMILRPPTIPRAVTRALPRVARAAPVVGTAVQLAAPLLPRGPRPRPGGPVVRPTPGVLGRIQRVLPGGASGYQAVPTSAQTDAAGRPITVQPGATTRTQCPPGYVAVTVNGIKQCMLKPVARSMKLWRPRAKPPISAKEWKAATTAARVEKKLVNKAKDLGAKMTPKRRTTRRG